MIDLSKINYTEPTNSKSCKAARAFEIKHENKTAQCWLLIHGYRGYPGELVRPAVDLFDEGFDVYVPRLAGCGTNTEDFLTTTYIDWVESAKESYEKLTKKYDKINLLGHSMGCDIACLFADNEKTGKVILSSPFLSSTLLTFSAKLKLYLASPFIKKIPCDWHSDPSYKMHYENAPCDDEYLGSQYYQYIFPKQLISMLKLAKISLRMLKNSSKEFLVINPLADKEISAPSDKLIQKALGKKVKKIDIPNGTHFVFYDPDPKAEELAVKAVIDYARV